MREEKTTMMGFGFGGFGMVYMLIFWVVIIGLAVWLLTRLFPAGTDRVASGAQARRSAGKESALDILQMRYARGEISQREYEQMRRDITE
jgi:putative membrane protein